METQKKKKKDSTHPLSKSSIKTIGFSGKSQVIPMTEPVSMLITGKVIFAPLLYSTHTPVNLLGRDILCPLKTKIMSTQDGLYLDFSDNPPQSMMPQLPGNTTETSQASGLLAPTDIRRVSPQTDMDSVGTMGQVTF